MSVFNRNWLHSSRRVELLGLTWRLCGSSIADAGKATSRFLEPHVAIANNPPAWACPRGWMAAVAAAKEYLDTHPAEYRDEEVRRVAWWFGDDHEVLQAALKSYVLKLYKGRFEPTPMLAYVVAAYERARFQPTRRQAAFVRRERR